MKLKKRLFWEEKGQGLAEYAFILSGVVAIAVLMLLIYGESIQVLFNGVVSMLSGS